VEVEEAVVVAVAAAAGRRGRLIVSLLEILLKQKKCIFESE
jgi:hypothetical protein